MAPNRCNCYFSFWATFCPFTSLTATKIFFLKKMKKTPGDIIILHKFTKYQKSWSYIYCSWDKACDSCSYFSFWAISCPFTPDSPKIQNLKKRYHHFAYVYQKLWSDDVWFRRYGVQCADRQTCGQMDRWMEKVAYRGGCPHLKNIYVLWEHVTSLSKWILKRSHQISGWHLAINAKHKILKTTFFYQHLIYYLPQQLTLFKEREFQ